jgi:hypothetical protein
LSHGRNAGEKEKEKEREKENERERERERGMVQKDLLWQVFKEPPMK